MPFCIHRLVLILAFSWPAVVAGAQSDAAPDPNADPAALRAAAEKLVGAWTGSIVLDEERLSRQLRNDGIPADRVEPAVRQAAKRVRETTLELQYEADGTYRAAFRNGDRSEATDGKWEVVAVDDRRVTIRTTSPQKGNDGNQSAGEATADEPQEKVETFTLELIDADHIRMTQPQLEKAHIKHFDFTRKKSDANASQSTTGRVDS